MDRNTRLIEDLKQVKYYISFSICSYCNFPHNIDSCKKCKKSWCGREYYCPRPEAYPINESLGLCLYCREKCPVCNSHECLNPPDYKY